MRALSSLVALLVLIVIYQAWMLRESSDYADHLSRMIDVRDRLDDHLERRISELESQMILVSGRTEFLWAYAPLASTRQRDP